MKINSNILLIEVDKLYQKKFDESDIEGVNKHIYYIRTFINACGYTEEEYQNLCFKNVNDN